MVAVGVESYAMAALGVESCESCKIANLFPFYLKASNLVNSCICRILHDGSGYCQILLSNEVRYLILLHGSCRYRILCHSSGKCRFLFRSSILMLM